MRRVDQKSFHTFWNGIKDLGPRSMKLLEKILLI